MWETRSTLPGVYGSHTNAGADSCSSCFGSTVTGWRALAAIVCSFHRGMTVFCDGVSSKNKVAGTGASGRRTGREGEDRECATGVHGVTFPAGVPALCAQRG
ncbi:hypothetical protein GCM10022419_033120 [Nonomuraea rosea]|uniref:Uncharacterized protein n=1 Tax=Nonomuraea rosea TaxID=638574 RepID=A0ABP6WEJ6_9ACTN